MAEVNLVCLAKYRVRFTKVAAALWAAEAKEGFGPPTANGATLLLAQRQLARVLAAECAVRGIEAGYIPYNLTNYPPYDQHSDEPDIRFTRARHGKGFWWAKVYGSKRRETGPEEKPFVLPLADSGEDLASDFRQLWAKLAPYPLALGWRLTDSESREAGRTLLLLFARLAAAGVVTPEMDEFAAWLGCSISRAHGPVAALGAITVALEGREARTEYRAGRPSEPLRNKAVNAEVAFQRDKGASLKVAVLDAAAAFNLSTGRIYSILGEAKLNRKAMPPIQAD